MSLFTATESKWIGFLLAIQGVLTGVIVSFYMGWALLFATVSVLVEPAIPYLNELENLEQKYEVPTFESAALLVVFYYENEQGFDFDKFMEQFFSEWEDYDTFVRRSEKKLQTDGLYEDFVIIATVLELTMEYVQSVDESYAFPVAGTAYSYGDSWHAARSYGGNRQHLGTDIMCPQGTELVAVCSGTIERIGWDRLGGWRIGLRGEDGNYYYYAHLSSYADGMHKGKSIQQKQLLGYAGNSGYGPQGTVGKFQPHLHFGIYTKGRAINPYPFLRLWEGTIEEE